MYSLNLLKGKYWEFPGSPVTKTPHVYCMGHGFESWSGNLDLPCVQPKKRKYFSF